MEITMYAIKVEKAVVVDGSERLFEGMIPLLVFDTLTGAEEACVRFAAMGLWGGCEFEPVVIKCAQ